ncbi:lipase 1-like [Vanessa atalanta]|uniref:lipase 1-like n=1 Tax=Vanessa atalanta TaxID=42275 RepID=UPI001FCDC2FA|nr:lipase 1-like [Vanessa atalanta]
MLYVLLLAFSVAASAQTSPNAQLVKELLQADPAARHSDNIVQDALLDAPGLIRKYGYPVEVHNIVTADGYVLQTHRIPHGRDSNNRPGPRPVALIMHGLLCSSADFLVLGPGNALAYVLAEAGYDVWLPNARGNYYSRRHVFLDPDDREGLQFWKFSWDEIGNLDLPAIVNFIVVNTGQQKMHYIGYSQGTTTFLVLNSLRPEYNDRFISFQALAPSAFVENNQNKLREIMAQFENVLEVVAFNLGFGELMGGEGWRQIFTALGLTFCNDQSFLQPLCIAAILGTGEIENFNKTMLPVFVGHNPAGAALRQIVHYSQVLRFGRFARYNNANPVTNLAQYGSLTPPEYDLSKISAPAYLHFGKNDVQSDYRDVLLLGERLGNTIGVYPIERETFNHFDFIWGGDVRTQLYDKLVDLMRSAERSLDRDSQV